MFRPSLVRIQFQAHAKYEFAWLLLPLLPLMLANSAENKRHRRGFRVFSLPSSKFVAFILEKQSTPSILLSQKSLSFHTRRSRKNAVRLSYHLKGHHLPLPPPNVPILTPLIRQKKGGSRTMQIPPSDNNFLPPSQKPFQGRTSKKESPFKKVD